MCIFLGESVMNDAVALVLSKSVETYSSEAGKKAFDTAAFFAAVLNFVGTLSFEAVTSCFYFQSVNFERPGALHIESSFSYLSCFQGCSRVLFSSACSLASPAPFAPNSPRFETTLCWKPPCSSSSVTPPFWRQRLPTSLAS